MNQTIFDPATPQAEKILGLTYGFIIAALAILLLVISLTVYIAVKFGRKNNDMEPRQVSGNRKLEVLMIVGPLLLVAGFFLWSVRTVSAIMPERVLQKPNVIITGHQWWWQADYPGTKVTTANEIHLPVGKAMLVELRSADVIHELWIPQLGPKMDTVPGMPNHLVLQADEVGEYLGDCAEYCGAGHAWMRLRVVVQTPQDFEAWERGQAKPTLVVVNSDQRGRTLFQSQTCIQCHSIEGVSVTGNVGPDLTHFGSRVTLGAGVLDNTPAELHRWLSDPQSVKPGCYMPNMRLNSTEIDDLTAYLEASK